MIIKITISHSPNLIYNMSNWKLPEASDIFLLK